LALTNVGFVFMPKPSKEVQETLRIIGQMAMIPHKPHAALKAKRKTIKGKGRSRVYVL
jgi:hypothetical protein